MDVREKIKSLLERNQILALATTNGSETHACNLHYYSDRDFNLYFVSKKERQHCEDILAHPEVAVCIYDPEHHDDNVVSGIQLRGICTPFTVNDGLDQMKAFYEKFPEKYNGEMTEILENYDFRSFFKIEPKRIRVID